MVEIFVNEKAYQAEEGQTLLEALRELGFRIPSLCYHPALKPSGSCKLCAVEVPGRAGNRKTTMLSCVLKVKAGMDVQTDSRLVREARKRAFERLVQMAPQSEEVRGLAKSFGIDTGVPPDGCIRCRLCIRVCQEVVGPGALRMERRGRQNYVAPIEGKCIGCGTCANICPTKVIHVEDRENIRTISIRDEIIGTHPLERCEGCGRLYATPRFLEHINRRTTPHPQVKMEHHYCPTCSKLFSDRVQSIRRHARRQG